MPTKRRQSLTIGISRASLLCLALVALFTASCERPPAGPDSTAPSASASANDAAFVGEVYVVSSGSEKLFGSGRQGSQEAPWIQPGNNEFRLYAQADHKLLAELT